MPAPSTTAGTPSRRPSTRAVHDVRSAWTAAASGSASVAASSPSPSGTATRPRLGATDGVGEPPHGQQRRRAAADRVSGQAAIAVAARAGERGVEADPLAGPPHAPGELVTVRSGQGGRADGRRRVTPAVEVRRADPARLDVDYDGPVVAGSGSSTSVTASCRAARSIAARTTITWSRRRGGSRRGSTRRRVANRDTRPRGPARPRRRLALDHAVDRGAAGPRPRPLPALPRGRAGRRGARVRLRLGRRAPCLVLRVVPCAAPRARRRGRDDDANPPGNGDVPRARSTSPSRLRARLRASTSSRAAGSSSAPGSATGTRSSTRSACAATAAGRRWTPRST